MNNETKVNERAHKRLRYEVTLFDDLIYQILLFVQAESLVKFQTVCKDWFVMINNSDFIKSHLNKCETLLLRLGRSPNFGVLGLGSANSSTNDTVFILSCLNGLVLTETIDRRLLLENPATRKHIELPKLTMYTYMCTRQFNLAFCEESKTYKVVYLFRKLNFVGHQWSEGCEILTVGTESWKRIYGLPENIIKTCNGNHGLFHGGLMYWISRTCGLLEMNVQNENFRTTELPMAYGKDNRLMDIAGKVGIVCHTTSPEHHEFEVWILDKSDETWAKMYAFCAPTYFKPVCCSRDGEKIFHTDSHGMQVCAYNVVTNVWRVVSIVERENWPLNYIAHKNTLVSWD